METYNILKDIARWHIRSDLERKTIEKRGGRVLFQARLETNDITIAAENNLFSIRVNGNVIFNYRTLDFAVRMAQEHGYIDEITAAEITKGKAAADKLRRIHAIRSMLSYKQ